jgi:hypothetical protein
MVALLAPFLLEDRKQKAEKRKRRAERLEGLIQDLYEYHHWLEIKRLVNAFGEEHDPVPSPLPKAETTINIYFHSFKPSLAEMYKAANQYYLWTLQVGKKRLARQMDDNFLEGLDEAYGPYTRAHQKLINEIVEFGRKEFGN